ncbi:hypothetical protein CF326_g7298 [Tilletia indica]|nr:hypothetical protein CF326_g7298 [Tilletia indica]
MAPKPDQPATRAQAKKRAEPGDADTPVPSTPSPIAAEGESPSPIVATETPSAVEVPPWAAFLTSQSTTLAAQSNQILKEQTQLRAQVTDVSKRLSRLEERPSSPTRSESASNIPQTTSGDVRVSGDARVETSAGEAVAPSVPPATIHTAISGWRSRMRLALSAPFC